MGLKYPLKKFDSPTLRCILQLRICGLQWVFFNGVKRSNWCNCPIRSLNFNQWVTAAGSKVDPTIARVDLNKRHVRDLAPVSGETNGARHNKRVLPLLN